DMSGYLMDVPEAPARLIYMGGMDWFPNRDAVEFFVKEILPRIQARAPQVEFLVAGRNPSEEFKTQFSHLGNVRFSGTVADMRALISGSTLCVVPLRIGSGTRLKILEASAAGKATVSTALGAEGLELVDGEEILIADDAMKFAEYIVALLQDPERRKHL